MGCWLMGIIGAFFCLAFGIVSVIILINLEYYKEAVTHGVIWVVVALVLVGLGILLNDEK